MKIWRNIHWSLYVTIPNNMLGTSVNEVFESERVFTLFVKRFFFLTSIKMKNPLPLGIQYKHYRTVSGHLRLEIICIIKAKFILCLLVDGYPADISIKKNIFKPSSVWRDKTDFFYFLEICLKLMHCVLYLSLFV